MTALEQRAPHLIRHLNAKKDTPDMHTDSNPVQAPFHLKIEDGIVVGTWDYQAEPNVRFTDAQVEQLDGPLPKRIYIDLTSRQGAAARPALAAAYETDALKAVSEHADKISMTFVPGGQKHDLAEIERLETLTEGDDEDGPPHFAVRILTDDPEAVSEYVARRSRPSNFRTAWPRYGAKGPLPAIAVSIVDNVATVTIEPRTAEFSDETKAAIVAADMQRVFIDARGLKPADYPQESLALLFREATLVCAMGLDCSKPGAEDDIAATHAIFDARAEDSPWVVRLFTDSPREWGSFIEKHRPVGRHCLAWPTYDSEPAAG